MTQRNSYTADLMMQKTPVTDCTVTERQMQLETSYHKNNNALYNKKQCLNYFKTTYMSIWKGTYFTLVLVQMMYSISSE